MSKGCDQTNAVEYVGEAMRGRLDDLGVLTRTANLQHDRDDVGKLGELGVELEGGDPLEDQATQLLDEYSLWVEATTTFEIVLGSGGPDDRLLVECDPVREHGLVTSYEIRRILYRYSWDGTAERVLGGTDYALAERFARCVVAELAESAV